MNDGEFKAAERNRFFYGKLLTAEDFITEQNYFNTKIRLLNSLIFGSGVVAGLGVIKADNQSVALDRGIALDGKGREIVVPEPVVVKIGELSGYSDLSRGNTDYTRAYLCIEYSETRTQPIHSIARTALDDENDGPEYNRISEGYSLYLTGEEPETNPCAAEERALIRKKLIGGEIDVFIVFPKAVRENEEFILETRIDKGSGEKNVKLEFDLKLEALTAADGSNTAHISYNRRGRAQGRDVVRTKLKAGSSLSEKGAVKAENVRVFCNKASLEPLPVYAETKITDGAELSAASLSEPEGNHRDRLYLARLGLYISPQYYILESVKKLPFSQIVPNAVDLQAFRIRSEFMRACTRKSAEALPPQPVQPLSNSGYLIVEIPEKSQKGQLFRSAEIPHGLGTGTVFIHAGYVGKGNVIFDSGCILSSYFTYGAAVDQETGMFSISVRLNRDFERASLKFCWLASRLPEKTAGVRKLEITPSVYYAGRYETVRFFVSHPDGGTWKSGELEWSVQPGDGGQITQTGVFTAFDKPGFYEISVSCIAEPDLKATAFLVVK